jgi:hypothetical protein
VISTQRVGRRTYFTGNTFDVKDKLRAAGAHWDGEKKGWWMGSDEEAVALATKLNSVPAPTYATFTKVGEDWGIRGKGLEVGMTVTVKKKDGTTTTEEVTSIVSTDADGVQIAMIVAKKKASGSGSGRRPGYCSDCGQKCKHPYTLCWDCKSVMDEDMGIYR